MPKGVYEATWFASWKVQLVIDDATFIAARDQGDARSQCQITSQFLAKCQKMFGKQPDGYVDWESKQFDIKRIGAAVSPLGKRPQSPVQDVECPCDFDTCKMCDGGDHYICRTCPRAA